MPLGKFLLALKANGDDLYSSFLNKYGDGEYSHFYLSDSPLITAKGIYLCTLDGEVVYIGRCRDSFNKRVNQG